MRTLIIAEPPAAYRARVPLVVDASVLCAILFAEATREQALQWMRSRTLYAPQIVDYEITNVALNKLRRGLATIESAGGALAAFSELDLKRLPAATDGVFKLATQWRLTAYDAAYLWLAAELKAPLATFDTRLGEAATAHLANLS